MESKIPPILVLLFIVYNLLSIYHCSRYAFDESYRSKVGEVNEKIYTETFFNDTFKYLKNSGYTLGLISALLISYLLIFSRWKSIDVFISYHLENEAYVEELVEMLNSRPLNVGYIPRSPIGHDKLIKEVQHRIRKSDVVLVIPGNRDSPNFTEAEVFAASTIRKAIVVMRLPESQQLPSTAFSGYPHFNWNESKKDNFLPIHQFLSVVFRHVMAAPKILKRGMRLGLKFSRVITMTMMGIGLLVILFGTPLKVFNLILYVQILKYIFIGIVVLSLLVILASIAYLIWQQRQLARAARQQTLTGELTFDILESIFNNGDSSEKRVLACLERRALLKKD